MGIKKSALRRSDHKTIYEQVNDKKIALNLSVINWLELPFALGVFLFTFYSGICQPIYEYNVRINVVREIVETGKSSYSEEIQKKYAYEAAIRTYRNSTLNEYRRTAANKSNLLMMIITLPLSLGMLYWLHISVKRCRDRIVFDREKGTVFYQYNYGLSRHRCKFDDAMFQSHLASLIDINSTYLALRIPNMKGYAVVSDLLPYISMSMYVWYMDINRPLPPGSAFDEYREADYLRRQSQGFPYPLYPSAIPTPEDKHLVKKYNDKDADKRAKAHYEPSLRAMAYSEDELRKRAKALDD